MEKDEEKTDDPADHHGGLNREYQRLGGAQMDKIDNALQQLIAAILASDVYSRYDVQRIRVNSMPELKAQIDEFRRKNLELQTNEHTTLEQIDSFERENAQFRENPVVDEFLAAELAFCRLIQELNLRLIDALHFE